MMWLQFNCFILSLCAIYVNSLAQKNGTYVDTDSLASIANNISIIFKGVQREYDAKLYEQQMSNTTEEIFKQMTLFNLPPMNVEFLKMIPLNNLAETQSFDLLAKKAYEFMDKIHGDYELLKVNATSLSKVIKQTLNGKVEKISKSQKLYYLITNNGSIDNTSFLRKVLQRLQIVWSNECNHSAPVPKQYISFRMGLSLISSQLKAFILDCIDYQNQYVAQLIPTIKERDRAVDKILEMVQQSLKKYYWMMKFWVSSDDNKVENCDVKKLQKNVNYIELSRVFQSIIVPEKGFKGKQTCRGGCSEMSGETWGEPICHGEFCSTCNGVITNCAIESSIEYCVSPVDSSRRYEWFRSYSYSIFRSPVNDNKFYGIQKECHPKSKRLESNMHSSIIGGQCDFCVCTCEENFYYSNQSIFMISTIFQNSDTQKNKVVTGIRFVKEGRMIETQIREGQLMPGGYIAQETDGWKLVTKMKSNEIHTLLQKSYDEGIISDFENFVVISSDLKHINLNDLSCPDGHLLTGVGLRVSEINRNSKRIVLSINCHPANLREGKIFSLLGTGLIKNVLSNQNKLSIGGLPPNQVKTIHYPDSSNDHYVEIQMSDLQKDAGQSVIPWFDAQDVRSTISVPLTGLGLYHRGAPDSGGFLAYRIFTIDYSSFMGKESWNQLQKEYIDIRQSLQMSQPRNFCGDVIPIILCTFCNGSYNLYPNTMIQDVDLAPAPKRSFHEECCLDKCLLSDLEKYCAPGSENMQVACY